MSKRRLVITAVLAGQSQSEVARTYGVSQGWISVNGQAQVPGFGQVEVPTLCGVDQGVGTMAPWTRPSRGATPET